MGGTPERLTERWYTPHATNTITMDELVKRLKILKENPREWEHCLVWHKEVTQGKFPTGWVHPDTLCKLFARVHGDSRRRQPQQQDMDHRDIPGLLYPTEFHPSRRKIGK